MCTETLLLLQLWNPKEVTTQEYNEFYRKAFNEYLDPLASSNFTTEATYINVDGDGIVPVESAKADGLVAEARVGIPGEHRGILCDKHMFRIVRHWLKADHDPFYNHVNDYV
ncbi:alpha/beta-Hydrolases superfamily protein [Artemisia annua]|uniref:Alpha/beta-Hydrolases superfamily protein n=1 Tax=Artemisia annua TaxID=35608 RepID=A0A2U1MG83_ARTAN|nr:alpha/beta-Hydrolases superfamily protein [Artemisia annua]